MTEHSCTVELASEIAFKDYDAVHKLLTSAFAYMQNRIDPPSSMNRLDIEKLREKVQTEHLLVALSEEKLVGCVFLKPAAQAWYLGKLAVDDKMRGQGIGRVLLEKAESVCFENSGHAIELEVRIELTENHRFFKKHGFVLSGENSHAGYDRPTSYSFRKQVEQQRQ